MKPDRLTNEGDTTMFNKTLAALSAAIILSTASVAVAKEQNRTLRHASSAAQQQTAAQAFGQAGTTGGRQFFDQTPGMFSDRRTYGHDDGSIYHRLNRMPDWSE
jgi:uncharacterized protein HemX